jgi:very-short-patch-repair endonuclease
MAVIQKTISFATHGNAWLYKEKGYIIENAREKTEIKVEDLAPTSKLKLKCKCDNCGKEFERARKKIIDINLTFCKDCKYEQAKITNKKRYNCENISQIEGVLEKKRATWRKNYGVDSPLKSPQILDKVKEANMRKYGVPWTVMMDKVSEANKQSCMEKYGVEYAMQAKEVRDKIQKAVVEKYGTENFMLSEKGREQYKETSLKHWGTEHPMKNEKIKKKVLKKQNDFFKNTDNVRMSRNQIHISDLLNGELNKKISGFFPDIVINDLIVEYDGGGHDLNVTVYKELTIEEFYKREKRREAVMFSLGYKIIRIICKNDKLPSDETILSTIDDIKNIFNKENKRIARWNTQDNTIIYE